MTYTLFHAPGACSRVTLNALEEVGGEFGDRALDIGCGAQKTDEYKAINPKGKVPALLVGERLVTESAAILWLLASEHPGARLLPGLDDPVMAAQGLSDLVWCSGTLHPMVRQMFRPQLFSEVASDSVKASGIAGFDAVAGGIIERLAAGWWYGGDWSIVDVYIYWITSMARLAGYTFSDEHVIADHDARVRERPSFRRALAREEAAVAKLGIMLPPGAKL